MNRAGYTTVNYERLFHSYVHERKYFDKVGNGKVAPGFEQGRFFPKSKMGIYDFGTTNRPITKTEEWDSVTKILKDMKAND